MKTTTKVALANTRFHRGKNILSGIAIVLTTLLIYLILTIGMGVVNTQNAAVNKIYPTWHGMFRSVSEETQVALSQHEAFESYGLRQDVASVPLTNGYVLISYYDDNALQLNRISFTDGRAPKVGNEVAVSQAGLQALGYEEVALGELITLTYQPYEKDGLGTLQEGEFQLTGFLPDGKETNGEQIFAMLTTQEVMEEIIPTDQRRYRMMVRLSENEATSTDGIEERIKEIGTAFNVMEDDVVLNSEYLFANYVDPAFYTGMAVIILVILIAGALTIYSIYYVSLIHKIQEFGKLKALGATKGQIRQMILKENLIVAGLAIPLGLFLGMISGKLFFKQLLGNFADNTDGNLSLQVMEEVVNQGEVSLILPWVVALTIVVSLVTVLVASLRPMRQVSKIMPIEAMRYTGQNVSKNQQRTGFVDLNLPRLTAANVSRNKKRTAMTIVSLGLIGMLFVAVATVFTCMQPQQIARDAIAADFRLEIESWSGDKMSPEREWTAIQQENPLSKELLAELEALAGVEKVTPKLAIEGEITAIPDRFNGEPLKFSIGSFSKEQLAEVVKNIDEGHVHYEELAEGETLIATESFMRNYPQVTVGDQLDVTIFDGDQHYIKPMRIVAAGTFTTGLDDYHTFLTTQEAFKGLSDDNLVKSLDIQVVADQKATVKETLETIASSNELFELVSYEDILAQWQGNMGIMTGAGYGILVVLGIVGVMNLINTTIDSILTRKKELGVMEAIGMSNRQMKKMLQLEGLFYAGGITLLSVGVGSLLGYACYRYAVTHALMQIKSYHYPVIQVLLLVGLTLLIQLLLTVATTTVVNKEPVIKRIQASE